MLSDPRFIITLITIGIAALYSFGITFIPIHIDKELMSVILGGFLTQGFATAIQFWLGSSHSSQNKDATIKNLSEGQSSK